MGNQEGNQDVGRLGADAPTALSSPSAMEPASGLHPDGLQSAGAFRREVSFQPGFDKRDPDPRQNYGIGSVRIRFVLIGELGAVQWLIGTDWTVPTAREHLRGFERRIDEGRKPTGWDLGYHSPRPMYDGQGCRPCDVLPEGCYYDGSGLNADLLIEGFIAVGGAYVWRALEAYYRCTFEDGPWPFAEDGSLLASVDTHPKDGDAVAAPLVSGAVGAAETPNYLAPQRHPGERP